jgi:hypothetical protein
VYKSHRSCSRVSSPEIVMETDQMFDTNTRQYLKRSQTSNSTKVNKHTIKYLASCTDPRAYTAVTRAAPDSAIQCICDAAFNIEQGDDIRLTPRQKALFRTHRKDIALLTSPRTGIARKRKIIQSQKGGFFFIPALIGAALGAIGSKVIGSLLGGQQQSQQ